MKNNCAKLDALKKVIYFNYEGENFEVDLTEGDLEDSWNSIEMKDGSVRDVNFSWQDNSEPAFDIYLVEENDEGTFRVEGEISLDIVEVVGTMEDYFREPQKSMKAVLVTFAFMVRVIADENATEDEIISLSKDKVEQIKSNWGDNVVEIEEDEECPFGTFETDKE